MIITDNFVVLNLPKTGSTFVRDSLKEIHSSSQSNRGILAKLISRSKSKRNPVFEELVLPKILKAEASMPPDQHGLYWQIPPQHKHKSVVSVVRNPYERLASQYRFQWWKQYPPLPKNLLEIHFPHFPDISFSDYIELRQIALRRNRGQDNRLKVDLGHQTVQFIQMFFKDPFQTLREIDDRYINSDQFISDMPEIVFLRTEHLNQDLFNFLAKQQYRRQDIEFILSSPKVNVSKDKCSKGNLWTEDLVGYVRYKERFLFKILGFYGLNYEIPTTSET